jgi:hypothetical protein
MHLKMVLRLPESLLSPTRGNPPVGSISPRSDLTSRSPVQSAPDRPAHRRPPSCAAVKLADPRLKAFESHYRRIRKLHLRKLFAADSRPVLRTQISQTEKFGSTQSSLPWPFCRSAPVYNGEENLTQTGIPQGTFCPVGVKRPVFWSIENTTKISTS